MPTIPPDKRRPHRPSKFMDEPLTAAAEKSDVAAVEKLTHEFGRFLWSHLQRRSPSVFERRWWDDRILAWAMADESVKVQMFRFIDVLPTLRTRESITRHLQEYFEEVSEHLPRAA